MKLFETTATIFVLNKDTKKLNELSKGTIVKPNRHIGDLCDIVIDKTLYEMTVDTFKEFFILSTKSSQ